MNRLIALAFLCPLALATPAAAQINFATPSGNVNADGHVIMCPKTGSSPVTYVPCDTTNPAAVTNTPTGTQAVNLTQILGAAPSLTNPLWVTPATGATFASTQSGTWTVQPGNTANTTPWLVSATLPTTGTIAAGNGVVEAVSSETGAGATPTSSTALAANLVVKASAGNLYSFEVSADSTLYAANWYIMIHNATSAPVDGAVTPQKCYLVPAATSTFAAAFPHPVNFSTGITIGVSTTGCFSKTASTHAFISGDFK